MIDKFSLGSTGFAQVGDPDYFKKQRIEGEFLLETLREEFKKELERFNARLKWVANPHDFGTYHDLELWIDIDRLSEDEQDVAYDFVNKMESIDFEDLELLNKIKQKYDEYIESIEYHEN